MTDETKEKWLGYARVSSPGQNLETQIGRLQTYAQLRNWDMNIYSEKVSAFSERDEMNKCIEEIFTNPEIKGIVVTHLDRLGRSVRQLSYLFSEMQAKGKQIVCIDQAIDTTTPSGRLMYNLLSTIAEFERELIHERLEAGRKRTKRYGGRHLKPIARDELLRDLKMGASIRFLATKYHAAPSTIVRRINSWKNQIETLPEVKQ